MRVGYARVSTAGQETGAQAAALLAAGCERVFEERASGAKKDRPELRQALDYLRRGDALVVTRLDRLARTLRQLIEVAAQLEERGIDLVVLDQSIDTATSTGKLLFHLLGAIAEFERGLARDRTRASLDARRAKGIKGGRPKAMDKVQISTARALAQSSDMSATEIARQVGVGRSTLYRYVDVGALRAAQRTHVAKDEGK